MRTRIYALVTFPGLLGVLLTVVQPLALALVVRLPTVEEVRHVHSQRMCDEQQIRELRVPLGVLVALDASAFHAGEVGQLLL